MKIAITGHADIEKANGKKRPAGRVYDEAVFRKVYEEIGMMMQTVSKKIGVGLDDMTLITGMARGVDEIFAHYAMAHDLSLIAAIPYRKNWHKAHSNGAIEYDEILDYIERRKDSYYKEIEKGMVGLPTPFSPEMSIWSISPTGCCPI